jgi:hypothetical protein
MIVNLTRGTGQRVAVNASLVRYVSDRGDAGSLIYFDKEQKISVQEPYEHVLDVFSRALAGSGVR